MQALEWEEEGNGWAAVDGRIRYRVRPFKTVRDQWRWTVQMDGAKIGEKSGFKTAEEAIDYVEFGGDPPRREKEQTL